MSNLSDKQIDNTFDGILQIPGGITSSLQTVQDGNGNPTGLQLSLTGTNATTASTAIPSVNGTPITGAVARPISDMFGDYGDAKDFGATGDGTTSDVAAFVAANSALPAIIVSPGNYYIASNITFTKPVQMLYGAKFIIPTGVTLTFNAGFSANIQQTFDASGTGEVVFNPQYLTIGYPEWWGALTNDGSADCTAALEACVAACPITELQLADYWIDTTWYINTPNRVIRGVVPTTYGQFARILTKSSTADIIHVGPTSDPGSINAMTQNILMQRITAWRSVPPTPPSAGNEINAPAGFRTRFILNCIFEDLTSLENYLGFAYQDQVYNHYYRLRSFRTVAGSTTVNDRYWGHALFALDGGSNIYGLASIYWMDITAGISGLISVTESIGIAINGYYTDCYFLRPECDALDYGFFHNSAGSTFPSIDNQLIGGVFDQESKGGVVFFNLPPQSVISVISTYSVVNNNNPVANFWVENSTAQISFINCQATGRLNYTALGLYIKNSKNVLAKNNMWCDHKRPIALDNASNCVIEDSVYNYAMTCTEPAVYLLNGSSRNVIRPQCGSPTANVYPAGYGFVGMTSDCQYNEINCSGIDPTGIQGGSANKLKYNGTQITTTGTFGTNNLASGIMG